MPKTTTVRVSIETRDAVRALAARDGVTLAEEIRRLARAERQRRMGEALAVDPRDDESAWLDLAAGEISALAAIADWGPAEDWADWSVPPTSTH